MFRPPRDLEISCERRSMPDYGASSASMVASRAPVLLTVAPIRFDVTSGLIEQNVGKILRPQRNRG